MATPSAAQTPVAAGSEALFSTATPLQVALSMTEADWDRLRAEGRSLPRLFSGCLDPEFSYTRVEADVVVGGETFPDAAVRKKGLLGSLSAVRPSLRVDVGRATTVGAPCSGHGH